MTNLDIKIKLSVNADYALNRNKLCPPNFRRVEQVLDRYGMALRNHWNDELEEIATNPWVSYCIYEWCDGGPVRSFSLSALLQTVVYEMDGTDDIPSIEEINRLIEITSRLSPFDQLAIMEYVEAQH